MYEEMDITSQLIQNRKCIEIEQSIVELNQFNVEDSWNDRFEQVQIKNSEHFILYQF